MVWQKLLSHFRATVPHLRPVRELMVAFAITGYLIYKLPISGERQVFSAADLTLTVPLPPPSLVVHTHTLQRSRKHSPVSWPRDQG